MNAGKLVGILYLLAALLFVCSGRALSKTIGGHMNAWKLIGILYLLAALLFVCSGRAHGQSLRPMWTEVHQNGPTRSRPQPSNRKVPGLTSQQVQFCFGSPSGLTQAVFEGGKVSTEVAAFAQAIARTEGYCIAKTVPNRLHNPGDIMTSLPHAYPGQVGIYRHYAVFKADKYGWAALESQIQRVIDGTSTKYDQSMTMMEIARVYAENYRYWGRTVCKILRISPQLTFQEYFGLAPRVRMTYDIPMWLRHSGDTMPEVQPMLALSPQIRGAIGPVVVVPLS